MALKLKMIGLALALWSVFATYKWISNNAIAPLECDNSQLNTRIAELEAANLAYAEQLRKAQELSEKQTVLGAQVRTEVRTVFVPVKEKVHEVPVPAGCAGPLPERVQTGLDAAVAAANAARGVPAAGD